MKNQIEERKCDICGRIRQKVEHTPNQIRNFDDWYTLDNMKIHLLEFLMPRISSNRIDVCSKACLLNFTLSSLAADVNIVLNDDDIHRYIQDVLHKIKPQVSQ